MGAFLANSSFNYTYNPANIAGDTRDYIRTRIGDWNGDPQQFLPDELIDGMIARYTGKFYEACAQCALAIANVCEQQAVRVEEEGLSIYYTNRAKGLRDDAENMRTESAPGAADPVDYGALSGKTRGPDIREYERLISDRRPRGQEFDNEFGL